VDQIIWTHSVWIVAHPLAPLSSRDVAVETFARSIFLNLGEYRALITLTPVPSGVTFFRLVPRVSIRRARLNRLSTRDRRYDRIGIDSRPRFLSLDRRHQKRSRRPGPSPGTADYLDCEAFPRRVRRQSRWICLFRGFTGLHLSLFRSRQEIQRIGSLHGESMSREIGPLTVFDRSQVGTFPDDRTRGVSVRKFWNSDVDPAEGSVSLRLDTAGGLFAGSASPVKLETFVSGEFPVRNVGVPVPSGRTLSR
jgi:hypothetical protein